MQTLNLCCDPGTNYSHDITAQTPTSLYVPYVDIDRTPPRTVVNPHLPRPPTEAPEKPRPMPEQINELPREIPSEVMVPSPARPAPLPALVELPESNPTSNASPSVNNKSALESQYGPREYKEYKHRSAEKTAVPRNLNCCQSAMPQDEDEYRHPAGGPSVFGPADIPSDGLCGWGSSGGPSKHGLKDDPTIPRRTSYYSAEDGARGHETEKVGGIFSMCRGPTGEGNDADEMIYENGVIRSSGKGPNWRDPEHLPSSSDHKPCDKQVYNPESQNVIGSDQSNWNDALLRDRPHNNSYFQQGSSPARGQTRPPFEDGPSPLPSHPGRPSPDPVTRDRPRPDQEAHPLIEADDNTATHPRLEDHRGPMSGDSWSQAVEDERLIPKRGLERHSSNNNDVPPSHEINSQPNNKTWTDQAKDADLDTRPRTRDSGTLQDTSEKPSRDHPLPGDTADRVTRDGPMKYVPRETNINEVPRDTAASEVDAQEAPLENSVIPDDAGSSRNVFNMCCKDPGVDNTDTYVLQFRDTIDTYNGYTPETVPSRPIPISPAVIDSPRDKKHQRALERASNAAHALTKFSPNTANAQSVRVEKFLGRLDRETLEEGIIRPAEMAVAQHRKWESDRYALNHPQHQPLYVRFRVDEDNLMRIRLEAPSSSPKWLRDSTFDLTTMVLPENGTDPIIYTDVYTSLPGDSKIMVREKEGFAVRPNDIRRQIPGQLVITATQISASCCASSSLRTDMERLYRSSEYEKAPTPISDCTVVCERHTFPANRSLLVARSRVFADMLAAKSRAVIAVSGTSPDVVRSMVDFVHTDRCTLLDVTTDFQASVRLFEIAVRFGILSLANELAVRLTMAMSEDNVDRLEAAARKTKHAYLSQAVAAYKND